MKIADTIDWRRVRSTSLLTMISQIYEKNAEYQDAKDIYCWQMRERRLKGAFI